MTSSSSPSRAFQSGVSVLEHLIDDPRFPCSDAAASFNDAVMSEPPLPPSESANNDLLGGSISTPAFALLVGVALENESKILSLPLTSLPTTFGKEHDTNDVSFVGLTEHNSNDGDNNNDNTNNKSGPKLSKSMCCIYYREGEQGGKLGCYKKTKKKADSGGDNNNDADEMIIEGDVDALNGMTYVPYEKPQDDNDNKAEVAPNDIIRLPSMQQTDPLPLSGFFAVECTGRKIIVGGAVLKKGQHAMLTDGITVQIASHCFYFLLPKNVSGKKKTIKVNVKKSIMKVVVDDSSTAASVKSKKQKKKRGISNDDDDSDATSDDDSSILIKSPRPIKKTKSSPPTTDNKDSSFASTLESKTDAELLEMLSQATESNGWEKHSQNIGAALATRACRAAAGSSKIQKLNRDFTGVTQRDVMNWINNESDTFGEYEKMMLRKIEPKSFGIAMSKAIIRAGYTKSDVKSGRANRWELPSDIIVPPVATVEPPTMKKSPQMKLLPTGGSEGGNKLPQKPMALPKASSKLTEEIEKEGGDKEGATMVSTVDKAAKVEKNKGDGDVGGGGDTMANKEESSKSASAVLPSAEDLKIFVEAWLARPENARVASTLLPNAKQKDEIVKECGVDKKRLESYLYRMRKKLKQKQETEGATATDKQEAKPAAAESVVAAAAAALKRPEAKKPVIPTMPVPTQQERENIAASRAFNEAIQSGSPFKVATEEASAAASAARANQNLPQPQQMSVAVQQLRPTSADNVDEVDTEKL